MKLVKLSLAAVVAAGSFSFANAVALDEAIQNVDLSGYLRYRYESTTEKATAANGTTTRDRSEAQRHRYRAILKFTSDIADNFKAVAVMEYANTNEGSYEAHDSNNQAITTARANTNQGFNVREAYLSYNNFDTTFSFGKMELGTFWTDDLIGNGVKVLNNSIEGVTLAAYMFDNYNNDDDLFVSKGNFNTFLVPGKAVPTNISARNIYGAAALVDFAPVSAELWVAYMNKVATFYAVDFGFNGGDEDFGYNVHAQYAGNSLKGEFKDLFPINGVANGNFYGIEAGVNVAGFDGSLGYVGFGKKDKWSLNSIEDNGKLMSAGEIALDSAYNGGFGKTDAIFGTLGYTLEDVRFGIDFVTGKTKYTENNVGLKDKFYEVTPRVSYKYSDKLKFSSYYAFGKFKEDQGNGLTDTTKTREIRLEAKYSF